MNVKSYIYVLLGWEAEVNGTFWKEQEKVIQEVDLGVKKALPFK